MGRPRRHDIYSTLRVSYLADVPAVRRYFWCAAHPAGPWRTVPTSTQVLQILGATLDDAKANVTRWRDAWMALR